MRACARCLGVDYERCHRLWGEMYRGRIEGSYNSIGEGFRLVAQRLDERVSEDAISSAEETYRRFTAEGLVPVEGAVETLEWLAANSVRLGLVTNCAPDVPLVWPQSSLARYFDFCAFSCELKIVKPDQRIYHAALDTLGLRPEQTLYVGDGSDEELTGAARCGLRPVLLAADLSNTYDAERKDVDQWHGDRIGGLADVRKLVQGSLPV